LAHYGISLILDWQYVWNTHFNSLAENWFGSSLVSTKDALRALSKKLQKHLESQEEYFADTPLSKYFFIHPELRTGLQFLPQSDQEVELDESQPWTRVRQITSQLGLITFNFERGLAGTWPVKSDRNVTQYLRIHRSINGQQYLFWYYSPLFSSHPMPINDVSTISLAAAIPLALQTAMYLSEHPFPSSRIPLDRETGLGMQVYGNQTPISSRTVLDGSLLVRLGKDQEVQVVFAPVRIDVGYVIPLDWEDQCVESNIRLACNTGIRLAGLLDLGYMEHNGTDLDFQRNLFAQASYVKGSGQIWIPSTRA